MSVPLIQRLSSIPVKVYTGKISDVARGTDLEDLLVNYEIVEIPIGSSTTCDELLKKCAIKCHILPLYLPLFAILDPVSESWVKLSDTVGEFCEGRIPSQDSEISPDTCLEFRIRFLVKTETQVGGQKKVARRWSLNLEYGAGQTSHTPFLDATTIAYLYRQRREDFLMDKIQFTTNEKTDNYVFSAALGVAVLDMLCLSKMTNSNITRISGKVKFKHLLPKSCREEMRDFNFCNRIRVRNKFNHYLRYFSPTAEVWQQKGRTLAFFQQRYLLNLELFSASYGVERYRLAKSGFITVSADAGITLHCNDSEDSAEKWCSFSELTDMTLQVRHPDENPSNSVSAPPSGNEPASNMCVVSLGRFDGCVKKFAMESVKSAENLASCIDGYYRLLVDAHHYLCKEVSSPRLVQHVKLGCHGPITCGFAEDVLKERKSDGIARIGDCVLRQSQEAYDEYYVNTICHLSPLEIRNFKFDRSRNRQLGLFGWVQSHRYETLGDLLTACSNGVYNGQQIPINPDNFVQPKIKHKSNLIALLCSDLSDEPDDPSNVQQVVTQTVLIELSEYREVTPLGNGSFTSVIRYARNEDKNKFVVFKSILDQKEEQLNHHINRSFQESTAMLNRLSHQHIVQHIGMTLSNMVALEYLPLHSITTYLEHNDIRGERYTWFLQVLWQITHACNYLEQSGFAHGYLCGKNILLQKDLPQPHIKLADPGVRTRIVTYNHSNIAAPLLTAPWLAYEFCLVDSREPNFTKYPTIEGDKWSFGTTVCEILNFGFIGVDPMNGFDLTNQMKQFYSKKLSGCFHMPELITDNAELRNLICNCWSSIPDKRPPFQQILRELGSALTGDYVFLTVNTGPVTDVICELEHGLPTYEDEKLTRYGLLGEGHFGSVELFFYDQYRNGQTEKVAVKKLKEKTTKRQQDFMQEIDTMRRINHPYVVRLLGIATPSGRIVMEYVKLGSLADELRRRRTERNWMSISTLLRFSSQIAEGMIALQQKRIIHRDLALRNILLGSESNSQSLHIKISDFGLSRFIGENKDKYVGRLEEFPAHWYAPECLCKEQTRAFRFESDIWSFGITIWEMFSYADRPTYPPLPPATTEEALPILRKHLEQGNRLRQSENCPNKVHEILLRCWAYCPTDRPSFDIIKTEFDQLTPQANEL